MYEQILYEVADPIATITLNRPESLNAWTARMGAEVKHALAQAEEDKRAVAILLTGAGRGFCSGADLGRLRGISEGRPEEEIPPELEADPGDPTVGEDLRGAYTYLMSIRKPIIAAINGPIAGMAVPIALGCDLRSQGGDLLLQGGHLALLFLHHLVQALDGGHGHPIGVHGADGLVVAAQAKGRVKVLGHRSHVA